MNKILKAERLEGVYGMFMVMARTLDFIPNEMEAIGGR